MEKRKGTASSMPVGLAFGAGIAVLITLLGTALLAKMLDQGVLQWEKIGYGIMIMLLLASFLGALAASGKIKRCRLQVSLGTGGLYWLMLLATTALFFGGQFEAVGVTSGLILAGSGCAGLLGIREKKGGNRRKKHVVHR